MPFVAPLGEVWPVLPIRRARIIERDSPVTAMQPPGGPEAATSASPHSRE